VIFQVFLLLHTTFNLKGCLQKNLFLTNSYLPPSSLPLSTLYEATATSDTMGNKARRRDTQKRLKIRERERERERK